jgi:Rad3-related DNA helicase
VEAQKRRSALEGGLDFSAAWPWDRYLVPKPAQRRALALIQEHDGRLTLELPTGTGKTAIGYTFLKALADAGEGPLFYVASTKTLVEQVHRLHPDVGVVLGRNEHPCLYYPGKDFRADEIPCTMLTACRHRVDQRTGLTLTSGARPCPYYAQTYAARNSRIVACTTAYFLFGVFFGRHRSTGWGEPAGLVLDEVHNVAKDVRSLLSFDITDLKLDRAVELLADLDSVAAEQLQRFRATLVAIVRRRSQTNPTLCRDEEIIQLLEALKAISNDRLQQAFTKALVQGELGAVDVPSLKQVETIIYDLHRYVRALEYALPGDDGREPLNYTVAYYTRERGENQRVQYRLTVKSYYVAPIIAKMLAPRTVAYSATIGNPTLFGWETGIRAQFHSLASEFPLKNTRIFLPTDTPHLAKARRSRQEPTRVLRRIARACHRFAKVGHRCLVLVVSEDERQKFLRLAEEERVGVVTYGPGNPARTVVAQFRDGEGECLVGTAAQFGEGIDLPSGTASVIFVLRPAYAPPQDPGRQFEERRFGKAQHWALTNWRLMNAALQARGRNIRSQTDVGVTFFISRSFDRIVHASLPDWLEDAYVGSKTFDECVEQTLSMLQ